MKIKIVATILVVLLSAILSLGQSTAFTYQGSLQNGGAAANGNFDFEFAMFDALAGGNQIGSVVTVTAVAVANGQFTVTLDFGSVFSGPPRFLDIRVRSAGGGSFTPLAPRQQVQTTPYATRALVAADAQSLGGVSSGQYVLTNDPRLTDARTPIAGNGNYIQNTITPQPLSNFNISGNGSIGGNLGIGTNSPSFKLTVLDPGNTGFRVQTNSGGGTLASFGGLGAFRVDGPGVSGGRFSILENGNTGIGTNSPAARLSVFGGGFANNFLVSDSNTTATTFDLANTSVGARTWRFQSMGSGDANRNGNLELWNVGGPLALAIRPDGNVGIGTTAPAAKLDVNGTIQSSSGGFKFPDGTVQSTAAGNTVYKTSGGFVVITPNMTVLQLDLPPGNYLLSFTMLATNPQSLEARELRCNFSTDPGAGLSVDIEPRRRGSITLSSIATLESQTVVNTVCLAESYVPTSTTDVYTFQSRMTAVKLSGNVIIQ